MCDNVAEYNSFLVYKRIKKITNLIYLSIYNAYFGICLIKPGIDN